jgi:hypothetical protein
MADQPANTGTPPRATPEAEPVRFTDMLMADDAQSSPGGASTSGRNALPPRAAPTKKRRNRQARAPPHQPAHSQAAQTDSLDVTLHAACPQLHHPPPPCWLLAPHRAATARMPRPLQPARSLRRSGPKSKHSPFIGVSQYKRTGRWEAHIWDSGEADGSPADAAAVGGAPQQQQQPAKATKKADGKEGNAKKGRQLHLGSFPTAEQAAKWVAATPDCLVLGCSWGAWLGRCWGHAPCLAATLHATAPAHKLLAPYARALLQGLRQGGAGHAGARHRPQLSAVRL